MVIITNSNFEEETEDGSNVILMEIAASTVFKADSERSRSNKKEVRLIPERNRLRMKKVPDTFNSPEHSILLADEPTGNFDSANGDAVMEMLAEIHQNGATICMVTHDQRYNSHAQRTVCLLDGRIVDEAYSRE